MGTELITEKQIKKMAKVFRITGKTFQAAAREAGLSNIPDHLVQLSKVDAKQFLNYFGYCFVTGKDKQ